MTLHTIRSSSAPKRARAAAAGIAGLLAASLWLTAVPASAQDSTPPGDPPGNNGTLKIISDDTSDTDPGSEPQLDACVVWLEFYGFDLDQQAAITFTAIPPTGEGQQLLTHTARISDDAAGGGQDKDATLSYNLSAALQGVSADPERGYHVKVASDTLGAPGGAKKKVFWMRCGATAPGALRVTKSVEGAGSGPFTFALSCNHTPLDRTFTLDGDGGVDITEIPSGTVCVVTETANGGATSTRIAETPSDGIDDGTMRINATTPAPALAFTNVFPAAVDSRVLAAEAARVLAAETARTAPGDRLPETGLATNVAAALGLGLIMLGSLLVARAERPRAW